MDLLELRIVRLEKLSQSLARELKAPQGRDDVLSFAERHAYLKTLDAALLRLHKGWGILSRAMQRQARRARRLSPASTPERGGAA